MASLTIARALFAESTTAGAENLRTPDPKEVVALAANVNGQEFVLDFGSSITIDTFLVGGLTGGGDAPWIQVLQGQAGEVTVANWWNDSGKSIPQSAFPRRSMLKSSAPVTDRYFRVRFNLSGMPAMTVGLFAVGLSVQPAWGHEWGSGRLWEDESAVQSLRGGGFAIERAARRDSWEFTCGDLTDAEVKELWKMAGEVGESAPVIVCEDPDLLGEDLALATHYGLFSRPQAYAREAPGATSWSFRVRGWV